MSNGIDKNPLLDISKVYLTQIAEKKDDSYLEPDMKKRQANNEKARKEMEKVKGQKNPHFEETQVVEKLDPVGQEDGDIDNDGDKDKSDKYLAKRRKAISNAIKGKMKKEETDVDKYIETVAKVKEAERKNDIQRWFQKESRSSNWRQDLSEIMTDDVDSKPIKEKNVKNKIKINPKLGEAIEEIGGELIEATEVDEAVYGGTPPEKKDTRMVVTNADKKANTPAYQAYKAGNKKYKSADHMNEGDGDPCWDSHKQVGMKKKGGKMVPNCVPKNEEVDHVDEKFSMAADPEKRALPRPTGKAENKKGVSAKSRTMKAVGTQRRQDKETGISGEKNPRAYREETEVEEGYKELSRDKRNTMFRKAGNLSRTALQGGDKGTEAHKKSGKIVKALNKDAEKYNRNDVKEDASMSPQELQLQKKKAMIDRMIAQKRQQGLNKSKKSEAPTKTMGEEAACAHSVKGKECPVHGKKDCSSMDEATEDSLRDRRMERGGVDGNNRYDRAPGKPNTFGKKPGQKYDGMSALEKVKANIRAKHGQGAIIDTKKK